MLPVALPVVPPACPAALPVAFGGAVVSVLVEVEVLGVAGVLEAGLCAGVAGVTPCVPCEDVLVWSLLFVVVVELVWLAALLGF